MRINPSNLLLVPVKLVPVLLYCNSDSFEEKLAHSRSCFRFSGKKGTLNLVKIPRTKVIY